MPRAERPRPTCSCLDTSLNNYLLGQLDCPGHRSSAWLVRPKEAIVNKRERVGVALLTATIDRASFSNDWHIPLAQNYLERTVVATLHVWQGLLMVATLLT